MNAYPKYKDSGIDWIGEIPEGWKVVKLGLILDGIQDGTHGSFERVDSGYPLLSAKNVFENGINISEDESLISEVDYKNIVSNGYPQKGDIAMCCVATIGRGCIYQFDYPLAFQRSVTFLRINDLYKNTYVLYFLKSLYGQIQFEMSAKASAQSGVYMGDLKKFIVTLPTKDEQEAIAQYLDKKTAKIDELMAEKTKQVEDLRSYRTSVITEAVTRGLNPDAPLRQSGIDWIGEIPEHWKILKIKYVFENLDYLREPIASENRERNNPKYDYYGASGVIDKVDGYNVDDKILLIGEDGANLVMRNLPLVYKASGKVWVNNHAHILKPTSIADYEYMFYMLESIDYSDFITGSAQPKLSQGNLSNVPVIIPPLSEQQEIAAYLDEKTAKIDKLIGELNAQLTELADYKQAVISEAVTGKVDVRNYRI
jgi:type I restriction enzyme S subunit